MPYFYTYLISSLPMLHFAAKPPFSFKRFLEICQDLISKEEIVLLKITSEGCTYKGAQPTLQRYYAFDTALRNELVKIRASRRHLEPSKYIRGDEYAEPYISHIAMSAYRNPLILEAEKMLDEQRWRMLDELSLEHYFDLDFLIVYAIKLRILERWERIRTADKSYFLQDILERSQPS